MKEKLMIVIVFCCITFLIASCNKSPEKTFVNSNESNLVSSSSNQNKNAKYDTNYVTDLDFALYSYDSSISIHEDDTIMDIKDKLGVSSLDKYGDNSIVRYQGTIFCVRDEKYCKGFIIQEYNNEFINFKTMRNIKLGDSIEQIKSAYGEPTSMENGERLLFYVYKMNGSKYSLLTKNEAQDDIQKHHFLQFNLNTNNVVTKITVGDYDFVFNRK